MENIIIKISQSLLQAPLLWGAVFGMLLLAACYKLRLCCEAEYAAGGRIAVFWRPIARSQRRVCLWARRWDGSADNIWETVFDDIFDDIIGRVRSFIGRMKRLRQQAKVRRWLRVSRVDIRAALPGEPAAAAMAGGLIQIGFGWLLAAMQGYFAGDCRTDCRVMLAGTEGLRVFGAIEVELRLLTLLPGLMLMLLMLPGRKIRALAHTRNIAHKKRAGRA